eukprot:g11216.t1
MAEERRQFEIFVRNAQEEYITTLAPPTSGGEPIGNGKPGSSPCPTDNLPSRCVVQDYTRDAAVLGAKAGTAGAVTMVSVRDADKLKSFRAYLAGRKKAGVVKLPGGGRFFLLPTPGDPRLVRGESIIGVIRESADIGGAATAATTAAPNPPPPRPAGHSGTSGVPPPPPPRTGNSNRASPPPPPPPQSNREGRSGDGGKGGGVGSGGGRSKEPAAVMGGFLGTLMGSMEETHKSVAGTAAVDRANRAQEQAIRQRVSNFEAEVREKIEAFATDPASVSHTFPHVEKSLRSIQHSLAEEFDGVTTRTEGEVDDRHVVVYKLGYEPPEEEIQVDPQVHLGLARNVGSSASSVGAAPMPALGGSGDLVRIGTVVKDRRTVQDIEEESRKRRRGRNGEASVGELTTMGRKLMDQYLLSNKKDPGSGLTPGQDLSTGRAVSVKVFNATNLYHSAGVREVFEWETELFSKTNFHPNVVQLLDVLDSPTEMFAVMEELSGWSDLFKAIVAAGRLEDDVARRVFGQMLDAIEHCHARGICHRDIKPENILVDATFSAKLTGFSLAWMFDPSTGDDAVETSRSTTCGTLDYMAPEVIQALGDAGTTGNQRYAGRPADLWSLGVTLYTMLAGYLPFEAESEGAVVEKVQAGDFAVDRDMTAPARALLDCLLELDPKKRFTVEQVRSHPWFLRDKPDEARRMGRHPTLAPQQQQKQQDNKHAPDAEDHPFNTGSQGGDGPAGVVAQEDIETKNGRTEERGKGLGVLVATFPAHSEELRTAMPPPQSRPPLEPQLLPRHVAVLDVDDNFKGSAEAAAFLYGDSTPSPRPSSCPSGFNSPRSGLESLAAGDPAQARRARSHGSVLESVPSFGTPISGFTTFGAHGAAGSSSSVLSDERSRRLGTFSSYTVSEEDRGRVISSSTC